jgi:PAS domain-containing protein
LIRLILSLAIGLAHGASALAASEAVPGAAAFLEEHCYDCHDEQTQKGKFRLDNLAELNLAEAAKSWARIFARLDAGEMPPPKKPRPPAPEVAKLLSGIEVALAAEAKTRRGEGRTRLRRLNRLEYENTVHDLLGIETSLRDLLPEDDTADGFDTAAKALSISPVHIQRYMEAAETALKAAIVRGPRPEVVKQRFLFSDPKENTDGNLHHGNNSPMIRIRGDRLLFFAEPHIEVPIHSIQFEAVTKAQPGRYRVRVSAWTEDAQGLALNFALRTSRSKKLLGYFDAPADTPAVVEVEHTFLPNDTVIIAPYRLDYARGERKFSRYPPKPWKEPEGLALGIEWIEIEGPLNDTWPPVGQQRLFGDVALKPFKELPKEVILPGELQQWRYSDKLTPLPEDPPAAAKQLLTAFLARAFRHPVSEEDVAPYLGIVTQHLEQKECFEAAMMEAYETALCSPDFLFLIEAPGPLSDHALASRLSYFLWRSAPDDALRAAADRGELHRPEVLRREAERLLASPRAQAFVEDFLNQWLHLRDLDATMPDKDLFPEFYEINSSAKVDGLLRASFGAETREFFADLLKNDGSLLQFIDSDFTYLNNRLAQFYGLPPVEGAAMRRVALPPDCVRGGLLTQASVLKVTANGSSTSPVLRGVWVLDNLIGRRPPPPPPNTGALEPDTRGATTIRELLAKHQNSDTCASCHRQIDPPGFALEGFDPIGQWRGNYRTTELGQEVKAKTTEGGNVKYRLGSAVDPSGRLPDGSAFAGPAEFKKLALRQGDVVTRCLASKLVTYSTGRVTEPGDLLALDSMVAESKRHGYGLRTLLHAVIQSELFVNK